MVGGDGAAAGTKWVFGYDHAGYRLAQILDDYLVGLGCRVEHFGPTDDASPVDYVPFCVAAATAVATREARFGAVIGGSGQGEQMAANKVRGVRAALCLDTHFAMLARRDNDANVIGLGARITAPELVVQIIEVWMNTNFEGGRHARRLSHMDEYERGVQEWTLPSSRAKLTGAIE